MAAEASDDAAEASSKTARSAITVVSIARLLSARFQNRLKSPPIFLLGGKNPHRSGIRVTEGMRDERIVPGLWNGELRDGASARRNRERLKTDEQVLRISI